MKTLNRFLYSFLVVFLLATTNNYAQDLVYPGDVNDDGKVNHFDVMNIGYAFDEMGSVKPLYTPNPLYTEIVTPWTDSFPNQPTNTLNYAYADADNNGIVDFDDFAQLTTNYGDTNELAIHTIILEGGEVDVDPALWFDTAETSGVKFTQGDVIELPIHLGDMDIPVTDLASIGFSVRTTSALIEALHFTFDSPSDNFFTANENAFTFEGVVEDSLLRQVAMTQLGEVGITGQGRIAKIDGVIEGDIIALLPAGVDSVIVEIFIEDIYAKDYLFNTIPIAATKAEIVIYHPNYLSSPGPLDTIDKTTVVSLGQGNFNVQSNSNIEQIEVFTTHGQLVATYKGKQTKNYEILLPDTLANGLYFATIKTLDGMATKEMLYVE